MINVKIGRHGYSMSLVVQDRMFGRGEVRKCVECQIYMYDDRKPYHFSTGIAICHPSDRFDPRRGAHKALDSALNYSPEASRAAFHRELESWFSNGQDV